MNNPLAQISLTTCFGSHRDLLLCLKGIFCLLEGVASFFILSPSLWCSSSYMTPVLARGRQWQLPSLFLSLVLL